MYGEDDEDPKTASTVSLELDDAICPLEEDEHDTVTLRHEERLTYPKPPYSSFIEDEKTEPAFLRNGLRDV